jgi:hypothetical protein
MAVAALALTQVSLASGSSIAIGTPAIVDGDYFNDTFYFGRISINAELDDPGFGAGKLVRYSLDGGVSYAPAGISAAEPPFAVNAGTTGDQIAPSIVALSEGGFVVAWTSFAQDGDGYGAFMRVFDTDGAPVTGDVRVNDVTLGDQILPTVAGLSDGSFAVTWASFGEDGDGFGVYGQLYGAGGAPRGTNFRVNDTSSGFQVAPAVAALDDGGFVVAWESNQNGFDFDIYAKRYGADGEPLAPERRVHEASANDEVAATVTALYDGGYVIGWREQHEMPQGDDVYARAFSATDVPQGGEFQVSNTRAGTQAGLTLAPRADGGFLAVWAGERSGGGGLDVFAQAYDANLLPLGDGSTLADRRINTTTSGDQVAPQLTTMSDGGYLIAWTDFSAGPLGRIVAQRLSAALAPLAGELSISTNETADNQTPAVTGLPDGTFTVAWYASGDPLDTSLSGILARRFVRPHLFARDLDPQRDITIVFQLVDAADPSHTWTSPPRKYVYAEPNAGADGSVLYADGYTRDESVAVGIVRPPSSSGYLTNDLYARTAPLAHGSCGTFEDWTLVEQPSTLESSVSVPLADGRCYQFSFHVENGLGVPFTYTSEHVLRVDRTAPVVTHSANRTGSTLSVTVSVVEAASGEAVRRYAVNNGAPTPFFGDVALVPLVDGANHVVIEVLDRAGNVGTSGLFVSADLRPPAIDIYTPVERQTYGPDVAVGYTLTQPLDGLEMTLDGVSVSLGDLHDLPAGPHMVALSGVATAGARITASVGFVVDATALTVSLLSPQSRTYPEDTLTVSWEANRPLTETSIVVDGEAVSGPTLVGLANGAHTLIFTGRDADGQSVTITRSLTVEVIVPRLHVTSPQEGEVLRSRTVRVELEANAAVTYTTEGASGAIVSGATLTLPSDGAHQITFTATLPSGAATTRTIDVMVDSMAPVVKIASPAPQLYAMRDMPILWSANKTLEDVSYTLDGRPVTALADLADGAHTFTFSGHDHAGRAITKDVHFQVAHLEILAPSEGEEIIDDGVPPVVDLVYEASGNFTTLTARLDDGPRQLLPSASGTFPLQLEPGQHAVTLQGNVNELTLARRVGFRAGARNVAVGDNAIKYEFTNCNDDLTCDVTVKLQIENRGDYDIISTFAMSFEVEKPDGTLQTFESQVDGILRGEVRTWTLESFRAHLEDTFRLHVDPDATLLGEDRRDNVRAVTFQPGRILTVLTSLSADNYYVEGARLDNVFAVSTAGAVAFVELEANGVYFRDNTGAQGFAAPVDMGMLAPEANYVVIRAYGPSNQLLDTAIRYFDVRRLPDSLPYDHHISPWRAFIGAGNRIVIDEVDHRQLAREEMAAMRRNLSESALAVYPIESGVDARGRTRVEYGVLAADAASLANKGEGRLAVGALTNMSFTSGDCIVSGVAPITSNEDHKSAMHAAMDLVEALANSLMDTLEGTLDDKLAEAFGQLESEISRYTPLYGFVELVKVGPEDKRRTIGFVWGVTLGGVDLVPPSIHDIHLDFTDDLERLDFTLQPSVCSARFEGATLVLSSDVKFDLHYLRSLELRADIEGGKASAFGVALGGAFVLGVPAVTLQIAWADTKFFNATFHGRLGLEMHYEGGIRGLVAAPALTIDRAEVTARLRVPLQRQRIANTEAYSVGIAVVVIIIPIPILTTSSAEINTFLDAQMDAVIEEKLFAPITLTNPAFVGGVFPDIDAVLRGSGHVFAKTMVHIESTIDACAYIFVCKHKTESRDVASVEICKAYRDGELVDGEPERDCPKEVIEPLLL